MVNLAVLAEDAKEALKYGVDGILVSNHGARQLDGVPATVSVYWRNETSNPQVLFANCPLRPLNCIFDSVKYGRWFTKVDAKQWFGCDLKFYGLQNWRTSNEREERAEYRHRGGVSAAGLPTFYVMIYN